VSLDETCYACELLATTKEHAPPRSFFPAGHRHNLITVPSCALHNNDNSMDVEYARGVVTSMFGTNLIAEQHFNDKVLRSFDRSPGLLSTTFADFRGMKLQGKTTGVFEVNIKRMERVMSACVSALHFNDTGQKQTAWEIFFANLAFSERASPEEQSAWSEFLSMIGKMSFSKQPTNSPDVFQYAIGDFLGSRIYQMRFYKAFVVIAFVATTDSAAG
jgi:hypothetical protein